MGAVTALTPSFCSRVKVESYGKFDGGTQLGMMIGKFTLPASYDTGGSTLDLSPYFNSVPALVLIQPAQGVVGEYVAGASAALGLVKCYKAVAGHTHTSAAHTHAGADFVVTGGGAAAGTKALYLDGTTALKKEEAGNSVLTTPTTASTTPAATGSTLAEIATQTANATDLSTLTMNFIAVGDLKIP